MQDNSWGALRRTENFAFLMLFCGGVWLFAADGLMVATLTPDMVRDIGGAHLLGAGAALFQAAAIVAGALSVFLVRRWNIPMAFIGCVIGFILGCLISAIAPDMLVFQIGRFFQALCGGGLVTLAHIGVAKMIPSVLSVRAFALISIVWGIAAFGAPLIGALFVSFSSWRLAFVYAAGVAVLIGLAALWVNRKHADNDADAIRSDEPVPFVRLSVLMVGVLLIAGASLFEDTVPALGLVLGGIIFTAGFIRLDVRSGSQALLPQGAFKLKSRVGSALYFIFFASASTVVMGVFGPLLLVAGFGLSPLYVGYLLFAAAAGWTSFAALLSGVRAHQEPTIIALAALAIFVSIPIVLLGFWTENVWLVTFGQFVDGAGFGSCWGLVLRRASQHPDSQEKERISSAINTVQRAGFAFGVAFLSIAANRVGFADEMSKPLALEIGVWVMAISTMMGLPALVGAVIFVRWPMVHDEFDSGSETENTYASPRPDAAGS